MAIAPPTGATLTPEVAPPQGATELIAPPAGAVQEDDTAPITSPFGVAPEPAVEPDLGAGDIDIESESAGVFEQEPVLTQEQINRKKFIKREVQRNRMEQKAHDDQFTFDQKLGDRLARGTLGRSADEMLQEIVGIRQEINKLQTGDPVALQKLSQANSPTGLPLSEEELRPIVDEWIQVNGARADKTEQQRQLVLEALEQRGQTGPDGELIRVGNSPTMRNIALAESLGDDELARAYIGDQFFEVAGETAVPSFTRGGATQLLAPGGAGLLAKGLGAGKTGTAVAFGLGSGTASFDNEFDASFSEFFAEEGVDIQDIDAIKEAIKDPDFVRRGKQRAAKAGLSVGVWDMIGGVLTAKLAMPPKLETSLATRVMRDTAALAVQPPSGALGEATKQLALEGEITSQSNIIFEGIGEIVTGGGEFATARIADAIGKKPQELLTTKQILDAYMKNPEVGLTLARQSLKEMAARGMTDSEAEALITSFPGILNDVEVLENNHSEQAAFDNEFKDIVIKSTFEDSDGNIALGDEIIDKENNTGNVYWSNGDFTTDDLNTQDGSTITNAKAIMDVAIQKKEGELNVLLAQGQDPDQINRTSNELETMKENQAARLREFAIMAEVRPQLQALVREMQQTFLPNTDIVVVENSHMADTQRNFAQGSAGAIFGENGKRTQTIFLNTDAILGLESRRLAKDLKEGLPSAHLGAVMGHEFGHSLMQVLTQNLPKDVVQALQAEHRIWLAEQVKNFDSPVEQILASKKTKTAIEHSRAVNPKGMAAQFISIPDSGISYHLSFNEWIADMVAKQLEGGRSVIPPMMKKVAPRFAALIEAFHGKFIAPNMEKSTVETFLDYVKFEAQIQAVNKIKNSLSETELASASAQTPEVIQDMLSDVDLDIPAEVQEQINESMDKYNLGMRFMSTLLQLGKANPHIASLQKYIDAVHGHWVTKSQWYDRAMQTVNPWRRLGRTADEVGRFLLERTIQSDELGRRLTIEEEEQLIRQSGIDFGNKAGDARAVIERIDADFNAVLEELYGIEKNRINRENAEFETRRKSKIAELDQTFNALRNRNYFPLSRFGVWGVTMKAKKAVTVKGVSYAKGQTVHMELFENKRQRNKGMGRIKREWGPAFQEGTFKVDESLEPFMGLPMSIMRNLKDNPKLGLSDDQKKAMLDMIDTMSPTNSIAKRMLERKGTAGFSRDAIRGYGNYMMQMGGHIAKMRHVGEMDDAIQSVRKSASALGQQGLPADKRFEIAEHLQRHQDYIMNPVNEWGAMRGLAFVWFLGYNVKSALVNLTQIPLVAYPYLAARKELTGNLAGKSDAIAIAELVKAMKDARQMFRVGGDNISIDEQNIIEQLVAEGIIDESLATELAGVSHADMIQKYMPKETAFTDNVHRGFQTFVRGSTFLFQAAEKFNRRAVALATIRLAKQNGMNPTEQLNEAREALRTTQFEYARWNRAAFMRGKAGVFFVFMQYLQNVLSFAIQDPGRTRYIMMLLMAGGLQALPGAEDLMDLYDFAGKRLNKMMRTKGDPRTNVREDLRDTILSMNMSPELLMHGLSAQSFGFGMTTVNDMLGTSIPALNLQPSLSAGRIVPGLEGLLSDRPGGFETAKDIAGAAITIPLNILKWSRDEDPHNVRSLERTSPSVMKGTLQAYRTVMNDGKFVDSKGNTLVDFDMNNPEHIAELLAMPLGFRPTRLSHASEKAWAKKEAAMYYETMRSNLTRDWIYAREEQRKNPGPSADMKDANEAIDWYNDNAPKEQGLFDVGARYARYLKNQAKTEAGIPGRILDIPLGRELDRLYPNIRTEEEPTR